MMVDLNALKDFVAVIREGSFSGAARALGIPKSTVSKRIQNLEAALGTRLIERTTRSLRLTAEGVAFHARAERIVLEAQEAVALLKSRRDEPKGHLRVSAPQLFGQAFLGPVAAAYRKRYPLTTLEIVLLDRRVDLIEEGFDAAIRIGALPDSSLVARSLASAVNVVVAAPALVSKRTRPRHPRSLADGPCIAFSASRQTSWRFVRDKEQLDVPITPVISIGSLMALREAALAGAGFAYLPQFIVEQDLAERRLALVFDDWRGIEVPVWIVYPSAQFLSARLRGLIDLLTERFPERRL